MSREKNNNRLWTRRVVLQRAAQLGVMGVATPLAINLAAIGEAAAFDNTDYKALVCLFMYGGNDYANTVVPYDNTNYNLYSAIRGGGANQAAGGIAHGRAQLDATALTPAGGQVLTDNLQYALAPQLTGLKSLWDAGRLAVQLNVGPLIQPTTLAQYLSTTYLGDASLPGDAEDTGFHRDGRELWLVPSREAAYLVDLDDPADVERWPASTQPIGCD